MDPHIKKFLQDLIAEAGLTDLPAEDQGKMLEDLYIRLEDRLILAVQNALPDDKLTDFQNMIESEDTTPEEVEQYIQKNLPNYEQVFAKAFADFRELYLSAAGEE